MANGVMEENITAKQERKEWEKEERHTVSDLKVVIEDEGEWQGEIKEVM